MGFSGLKVTILSSETSDQSSSLSEFDAFLNLDFDFSISNSDQWFHMKGLTIMTKYDI